MSNFCAFRLKPRSDLYESIIKEATRDGPASHCILTCVGSLKKCKVRLAGATATDQKTKIIDGPLEIVSLVGTIAGQKAHIHISVSDKDGNVFGGHLMPESIIETTAEIVLADLKRSSGIILSREFDQETGFSELCVHNQSS